MNFNDAIKKTIIAPLQRPNGLRSLLFWFIPALLIALSLSWGTGYKNIGYVLSLLVFLCVARFHRVTFWLACGLVLFACFYLPVGYDFGKIRLGYLISVVYTNEGETLEFIRGVPFLSWVLTGSTLLATFIYTKYGKAFTVRANYPVLLLFIILVIMVPPAKFAAGFARNVYRAYTQITTLNKQIAMDDTFSLTDVKLKYKNVVVVVGESVSREYLSLYGYTHSTTPWLNQAPGLFFSNYVAVAGSTALSLTRTLARSDGLNTEMHNNVLALANKAGFATWWISNQGFWGKHNAVTNIAIKAQHTYFSEKQDPPNSNDDMNLLPYIKEAVHGNGEKVIFVHMLGSHPEACDRLFDYPVRFAVSRQKEVNCYLATIEKLDTFIKNTVAILQERHEPWALVYFSDHGVAVDESERPLKHGEDSKQNFNVPFFILTSDQHEHVVDDTPLSALSFLSLFEWVTGINSEQVKARSPQEARADNIKVFNNDKLIPYAGLKDNPLVE